MKDGEIAQSTFDVLAIFCQVTVAPTIFLHLRKHPCSRYAALSSTVELLPYIGIALQEMKDDREYQADWDKISTMLRGIQNFSFVYAIVVCSNVMASTKSLCTKLQGTGT